MNENMSIQTGCSSLLLVSDGVGSFNFKIGMLRKDLFIFITKR